ncbi:3'(2'),5'-bisphosphate nucleotidase CysQ [Helicobacter burdigaliensis]|uniref:3'(2'),5'-bisphosphate nucleotidase CysQ n=1 Tax=Helicobacter burdigaliensis TaxID=2315334 RepID=UPI000EF64B90|nr:3'(2'),5'-bisphosphate nucleotidase CysQ [Helicobacter burdigaliensis]
MLDTINLEDIRQIAQSAAKATLEIYNRDFDVEYKEDHSPLTEADKVANSIICEALKKYNLPIMSEENKMIAYKERKKWEWFWCVDPIDGTKEFIKKNGEWTINIALIYKDTPVLGVVYAPATDIMYSAKRGEGAYKNGESLPLKRKDKIYKIVASKSHMNEETQKFIDNIEGEKELVSIGSSLKLCMVASNEADCYPRFAPTKEWDTAAADAIVREAGKMTYQAFNEKPLVYNKQDLLNPYFIVK